MSFSVIRSLVRVAFLWCDWLMCATKYHILLIVDQSFLFSYCFSFLLQWVFLSLSPVPDSRMRALLGHVLLVTYITCNVCVKLFWQKFSNWPTEHVEMVAANESRLSDWLIRLTNQLFCPYKVGKLPIPAYSISKKNHGLATPGWSKHKDTGLIVCLSAIFFESWTWKLGPVSTFHIFVSLSLFVPKMQV